MTLVVSNGTARSQMTLVVSNGTARSQMALLDLKWHWEISNGTGSPQITLVDLKWEHCLYRPLPNLMFHSKDDIKATATGDLPLVSVRQS